jgi:TusA-related sulfurtransferase
MTLPSPTDDIFLDLCGLYPPEPMERTLDALATLLPGQQLCILIDREPLPLFRILERNHYTYSSTPAAPGRFSITIKQDN